MVNNLLNIYAKNGIIKETDSEIASYFEPSSLSPLESANEIFQKTVAFRYVFDEYVLYRTLVEGLLLFIRNYLPA